MNNCGIISILTYFVIYCCIARVWNTDLSHMHTKVSNNDVELDKIFKNKHKVKLRPH